MRNKVVASLLVVVAATCAPMSSRAAGRPAAARSTPAASTTPAPREGDSCRRLPAGKRLKLNLKPNTDLVDLVSWISAITCKRFIVPGTIPPNSKTVTIVAPQSITVAEAYTLFLSALESVGLTVYSSNGVLRVIETAKIKMAPIPVVIDRDLGD